MPAETRRLVQLAAADPSGDQSLVLRAAGQLGIPVNAGAAAVEAKLVEFRGRIRFRHPLARSAAYRSASIHARQQMHAALAEVTDPVTDPDRRAWHRAQAADRPDEEVAVELERSAGRAQARGGLAAAAAFLERSVALTADPARQAERALAAAQASMQAAAIGTALELLATAEAGTLDEFARARADLLRGDIAFSSGHLFEASSLLLKAARRLELFDLDLARETYVSACGAAIVSSYQSEGGDVLLEVCRAIRALPPTPGGPRALDLTLEGLALLFTEGPAAAAATLRQAAAALQSISLDEVLRWGWVATTAGSVVSDYEAFHQLCLRQVQLVRDAGALAPLPLILSETGIACVWMGDFAGAESTVAESASVAAATGSRFAPYALMLLRAHQGRAAEASAAIANSIEQFAPDGRGSAVTSAYRCAAVLYNGLARYDEAASAAQQATANPCNPWEVLWGLPELVEATARLGNYELARDALDRLAVLTQAAGNDSGLGLEARCRALVSDGVAADELYREAIDRLGRTRLRPALARAQLLYGEWLRREGRRIEARTQLRTAHGMLTAIGMEAFAERARRELLVTGERVRRLDAETRDQLTPQEEQIARLARDGRTNPEIATQLFLSARTVEWHLRKVFGKLGVSSRRELGEALAQFGQDGQPA